MKSLVYTEYSFFIVMSRHVKFGIGRGPPKDAFRQQLESRGQINISSEKKIIDQMLSCQLKDCMAKVICKGNAKQCKEFSTE